MQRVVAVFCVLALPLLVTAASADSNPYVSTALAAISPEAAAGNCQSKLSNNAYDCHAKSSFGTKFLDCFQFVSPGTVSGSFDLVVSSIGAELGCSCNPTGSFKKPRFNRSPNAFDCVGTDGFNFTGRVKR